MLSSSISGHVRSGLHYFRKNPTAAICVLLTTEVAIYAIKYLRQLSNHKKDCSTALSDHSASAKSPRKSPSGAAGLGATKSSDDSCPTEATSGSTGGSSSITLQKTLKKKDIRYNLSGACAAFILYGAAAYNIIPHLSLLGVVGFTIYAIYRKIRHDEKDEEYFSVKWLHKIFTGIFNFLKSFFENCHPAWLLVTALGVIYGIYRGILAIASHLHRSRA